MLAAIAPTAEAASGTWTLNGAGNWSGTTNWQGGIIADGAGSTADFTQLNITGNRVVTIDGAVASRTLGSLLVGDSLLTSGTWNTYTIASSGGGTLTFNNGGSTALLAQAVNSGVNTITAPIVLADALNITNSSTNALNISGGITGPANLVVSANNAGGVTFSATAVNNGGTITNSGTGTGVATFTGTIGSNVTGVVQDSATSQLTLSSSNSFGGGLVVRSGTVLSGNNGAFSTGTVTLGHTSGNADTTLLLNSVTASNAIIVQSGNTGSASIVANGNVAARVNGNITLDKTLTLTVNGGAQTGRNTGSYLATAGIISGTGNLNLNVIGNLSTTNNGGSPQMDSLTVGGTVATTGAIINSGTGNGRAIISGPITSASSLSQNSATSMLSLGGTNTYSGATNVNAGVLRATSIMGLSSNSAVTVASGASLQFSPSAGSLYNPALSLTLAGDGNSYSSGALEALNVANYAGAIVLAADTTVAADVINGGGITMTLSGGITGSGRTLTAGGGGFVVISGAIATGSGGLKKQGQGLLTLSGTNTYTGLTTISGGGILLNNANALNGGGNLTFDGGFLRHSGSNTADLGNRIVNSSGPISIDTNAQNVIYSDIAASNTGGLTKLGTGRLTLSGSNAFSGPVAVNAGVLAVSATSALPSLGAGTIFIDKSGALNSGGAYANVQSWLNSGNISASSTGAIALTGASSENIDFTGYNNLSLGASTAATYTGVITPAAGTYRLGGGGAALTLSGVNALTGTNGLVVNGAVTLSAANNLTGATVVASNTLTLTGTSGGVAGSAVSVSPGAILAVTSATTVTPVTRASSVTLNRGTMTITGNATSNSVNAITNDLSFGKGGSSTVTITQSTARNSLLTANNLTREAGATGLVRGTSLGVNTLASQTATAANISLANPILVGASGTTTDRSIFVGMIGDTAVGGTGVGATGGLLTYDTTYGVRLLSAGEYKTTITDGQTQLDNIRLTSASGTSTSTVNLNTTVNSLSIATSGTSTASVQVAGTGTLTLNSGVIHVGLTSPAATAVGVANGLNFNGREGVIFTGNAAGLQLSGVLGNTGSNGLTIAGTGRVTLSGASANTYTGTTTINGGTLELNKTAGVDAITGDVLVNTGGVLLSTPANQIADTANVTVNGGTYTATLAETINNLTLTNSGVANLDAFNANGDVSISSGASLNTTITKQVTVAGALNISDGGSLTIKRSQSILGLYDTVVSVGALNITNTSSGAYVPITIDYGSGLAQSGGKLQLNGDVTFTGNTTNTNPAVIDGMRGSGRQGVVELSSTRSFNIGNGAAKVDLRITAPIVEGVTPSGLTKTGLGTLELTGANTYTGATVVNAGTLLINGTSASAVTVSNATFGGTGTISNSVTIGSSGTLAPGNSPGVINTGDLSLTSASSTIAMEIAGTGANQYDQINVTGAVNLNGNGQISLNLLSYVPQLTDIFFLVLNDGNDAINGTLFNLAQGGTFTASGYTWKVSYVGDSTNGTFLGGNDLALQMIPEPGTAALLVGGMGMLALSRRRRN